MDIAHEIRERARRAQNRIVLPEGDDPRIRQAAAQLASAGLVKPVLLCSGGAGGAADGVELIRPANDPRLETFAEEYHELRREKGVTKEQAMERALDPLVFGAFLIYTGIKSVTADEEDEDPDGLQNPSLCALCASLPC